METPPWFHHNWLQLNFLQSHSRVSISHSSISIVSKSCGPMVTWKVKKSHGGVSVGALSWQSHCGVSSCTHCPSCIVVISLCIFHDGGEKYVVAHYDSIATMETALWHCYNTTVTHCDYRNTIMTPMQQTCYNSSNLWLRELWVYELVGWSSLL